MIYPVNCSDLFDNLKRNLSIRVHLRVMCTVCLFALACALAVCLFALYGRMSGLLNT